MHILHEVYLDSESLRKPNESHKICQSKMTQRYFYHPSTFEMANNINGTQHNGNETHFKSSPANNTPFPLHHRTVPDVGRPRGLLGSSRPLKRQKCHGRSVFVHTTLFCTVVQTDDGRTVCTVQICMDIF